MYLDYWGLTDSPFSGPDDPYWFFESSLHEEALARLLYLADKPPRCGLLVGPAGTGKSLLLELVRRQRSGAGRRAARIAAAGSTGRELLWDLAAGFGLAPAEDAPEDALWRDVRGHFEGLLVSRTPALLLFDDADRAEPGGHRAIARLLAESHGAEQLTVIVAAQPDGVRRLPAPLLDRCDLRAELAPLDADQTGQFALELLARGGAAYDIFDDAALAALYERTGGTPRRIRRLCDLSLLGGMSEALDVIDAEVVHAAADEIEGDGARRRTANSSRFAPSGTL